MTLSEFDKIFKQFGSLLLVVTSLSISSELIREKEVDTLHDNGHRFYDSVVLLRYYTRHTLRPYIASENNQIRHFIKGIVWYI